MRFAFFAAFFALGCSSSDDAAPASDGAADSVVDSVVEDTALVFDMSVADTVDSAVTDSGASETTSEVGLPTCFGETKSIQLGANLPFVEVWVGTSASKGSYLVDFATTASTIDLAAFSTKPTATGCDPSKLGQSCTFADFDFFGSWGSVHLYTADHSGLIGGIREAGILGTDFLSVYSFALDYSGKKLSKSACGDGELSAAGFAPLSSEGFYAKDYSKLKALSEVVSGASGGLHVPNVPTVPVKIAGVSAVAQLDTGFADSLVHHSLNVNVAYYDAIVAAAPTALVRDSAKDLSLSTCVGVSESVEAYTLASGTTLQFVSTTGAIAHSFPDTVVFVKRTPPAAKSCGGIGTWTTPAAQVAASFFVDMGVMVLDPVSSRVWIR
ncbi:MAG: hypothetical protein ACXWUG_10720 [Polyangiales bacterium]